MMFCFCEGVESKRPNENFVPWDYYSQIFVFVDLEGHFDRPVERMRLHSLYVYVRETLVLSTLPTVTLVDLEREGRRGSLEDSSEGDGIVGVLRDHDVHFHFRSLETKVKLEFSLLLTTRSQDLPLNRCSKGHIRLWLHRIVDFLPKEAT